MRLKLTIWFGILLLPLLICSCWTTKQVKQVRWQGYTFQLTVSDGGATTSFNWKVVARSQGIFGTREEDVFEAYGGPFLKDIAVEEGHYLVLFANEGSRQERIEIDLQHLDAFLDEPVLYHRYTLKKSNSSYVEPEFIKSARKSGQQRDLEMAERRRERDASQN
jgi:hypothetical protein